MTVAGSMQNVNNSPVATMPAHFELNYSKSAAEVVRSEGEWTPEEPDPEWVMVQRKRYRNRMEGVTGRATVQPGDKFKPGGFKNPALRV